MNPAYCAGDSTPTRLIQWDSSWPRFLDLPERRDILAYLERRFGIPPAAFIPYHLLGSSRVIYLVRKGRVYENAGLKVMRCGLPFVRRTGLYLKPTTVMVQRFGDLADKNVVDLEPLGMKRLLSDGEIDVDLDIDPGYVIVRSGKNIWGVSLYLLPGRLLSRFPKGMRQAIV